MKLKITSEIAANDGMAANVELVFREFYVNKAMQAQFGLDSMLSDMPCKTLVLKPTYNYQLEATPTFEMLFGLVKAELESQGMTVEIVE